LPVLLVAVVMATTGSSGLAQTRNPEDISSLGEHSSRVRRSLREA
jgi:hypothetical protein